ncbi:proline-specific peptidase [Xylaria curta]|nr:proline-specific peptidase [Xylaria curta]
MTDTPILEGEVKFEAPNSGKAGSTWYKVYGDLNSKVPALVALHSGPGAGHEYLSPLTNLYQKCGIPIIFYDQVGCGRSTHHREELGNTSFWTFDLFSQELDNPVDHLKLQENGFSIIGQSWGGMLSAVYATHMKKASDSSDHDSPEYKNASEFFYKQHVCRLDVEAAFKNLHDDNTAYLTMQGPSELVITGSLKDWERWEIAHEILVDTPVVNGRYMTDVCVRPWFKAIPRVKWVTFEKSSHMAYWKQPERFIQVCEGFLSI